jgi:hypothetical protein
VPGPAVGGFAPPAPLPLFDVELGKIFLTMRSLLGISLWDMARRVEADPTIIANLEAGALSAMPPWPELTRLVDAYAQVTGIDQQPILARLLRTQVSVNPGGEQRALPAPQTITLPAQAASAGMQRWPSDPGNASWHGGPIPDAAFQVVGQVARTIERTSVSAVPTQARRVIADTRSSVHAVALAPTLEVVTAPAGLRQHLLRAVRSTLRGGQRVLRRQAAALGFLVVLPGLIVLAARSYPATLYSVVAPLPSVVALPLHTGVNQLVAAFAPEREGLVWIDIGDPRLRKTNRLPERAR